MAASIAAMLGGRTKVRRGDHAISGASAQAMKATPCKSWSPSWDLPSWPAIWDLRPMLGRIMRPTLPLGSRS